ncbi:MAG: hypothetical protein EBR82_46290 [Caulobacteraceae bacterium]|nr:hypothetical protein [Caulobacteraceae bacterium]
MTPQELLEEAVKYANIASLQKDSIAVSTLYRELALTALLIESKSKRITTAQTTATITIPIEDKSGTIAEVSK